MATTADGTEKQLYEAIVNRLIEKVPGFTETNCFFCDQEFPDVIPMKLPGCTVSPGDASFDQDYYSGGGAEQLTQITPFTVAVFMHAVLDTPGKARVAFFNENFGILSKFKPAILQALLQECEGRPSPRRPWCPEHEGNVIVRDGIWALSPGVPQFVQLEAPTGPTLILGLAMRFQCLIDLDVVEW